MTLHWQSPDTGSREYGPNWPDWAKFDSELNFNLSTPGLDLNCSTLFPLHQLPSAAINCGNLWETEEEAWKDGERVSFKLEKWTGLGERVPELSFLLGIWRGIMDEFGVITTYYAEQAITANDYTEPTTHLYCVLGRPFDGFRCRDNFKPIDFDAVVVKEDVHIWSLKRAN
ncbi:hypothetical protein P154DRAFT_578435 [Amniculicola lignicola CBS 123094]|uniref:Uncharacterized protein n=1 Tax=Amniculicola lignicola CBS 123094 TaxID=1392246 RepID=A0A6A5WFF5_9PLEO|nr:hypothetical protein P154DRAFT_578435 [Amniculicola lignicola CBS 123094]